MMSSYTADLLHTIAKEINRQPESVDPFIKILENNWFDTKESLKELNESVLQKLNIPERLAQLILKKINPNERQIIQNIKINENQLNSEIKVSKGGLNIEDLFINYKKKAINNEKYKESLDVLRKIFENILKNPKEEKYRTIKFTNKIILEQIKPFQAALEILKNANFDIDDKNIILKSSKLQTNILEKILERIIKEIDSLNVFVFNPYKSSILSYGGVTTLDVMNKSMIEPTSSEIDKMEEIKKKRKEAIKPINDRKIKGFKVNPHLISNNSMEIQEEEQIPENEDFVLKNAVFEIMKNIEESQKFSSKRKKELEEYLKKPFFIETTIRIKFPNNTILEARFTPLETLQNVLKIVLENLDPKVPKNFFLFRTPPYEKLTDFKKSLEELECVPNGTFYFGLEEKEKETLIQNYLSSKIKLQNI